MMVMPSFLDAYAEMKQSILISSYSENFRTADAKEIEEARRTADAYNEKIRVQQQSSAFSYLPADPADKEYQDVLCGGDADNTMALLTIPEINVSLPVVHGTDEEQLKYEAGHMYGTSLPSGGTSTHCVIAAHTGLVNAKLFTDLVKLEEGDTFSITVLNEKHIYTIDRILVVFPEEEDTYLQVEDGFEFVTLYTCTPYGVNDHRLLVRGIRTGNETIEEGSITVRMPALFPLVKMLLCISVPLAVPVMTLIFRRREEGLS